jgi:hypothetical protein
MTHLERLFAALWLSEGWYVRFVERTDIPTGRRLYARTRAVVLFDQVITGRIDAQIGASL